MAWCALGHDARSPCSADGQPVCLPGETVELTAAPHVPQVYTSGLVVLLAHGVIDLATPVVNRHEMSTLRLLISVDALTMAVLSCCISVAFFANPRNRPDWLQRLFVCVSDQYLSLLGHRPSLVLGSAREIRQAPSH